MSKGLTYDTESQAKAVVKDLEDQGILAGVERTPDGKFKVVYFTGSQSPRGYTENTNLGNIGKDKDGEEDFFKEEKKWEKRQEWREKRPHAIKERRVEAQKEALEIEKENRKTAGLDPGRIVAIRDPKSYEITGYKLVTKSAEQRAYEVGGKKMRNFLPNLPVNANASASSLIENTSRSINFKKGMQSSIPGNSIKPKAVITALPTRESGVIGESRPAIGTIKQTDVNNIGVPYLKKPNGDSPLRKTIEPKKIGI